MRKASGQRVEGLARPPHGLPSLRTFSSLRYRTYRYLWGSTLFSSAGNWIQQVTLGWLAYDLTGSAFLVGTLHGLRALPFLLVGPVGGVIADRTDRRKLLLGNQLFLALLALGFAVLVVSGHLEVWHLFVFTFLSGAGWAFNNPVRQALVANSVPRSELMNAIALNSVAFNINRVLGPAAGGVLIAFFGPGTNFFIQAACYVGVFLMVLPIRVPQEGLAALHGRHGASLGSSLVAGLRYVAREETTLALILVALIPSLFIMPFISGLMPVFSEEVLGAGPSGLGLLLSFFGLGALVGVLGLASLGTVQRRGLVLLGAAMAAALGMLLFSQTRWLPLSLLTLMLVGGAHMVYMATNNTILQTITPDEYRGRVMSIYMLDHGLVPLGGLLAGTLAQFYGSPLAILAGGLVTVTLVLLVPLRFKALVRLKG